jgi:hypothetical protein
VHAGSFAPNRKYCVSRLCLSPLPSQHALITSSFYNRKYDEFKSHYDLMRQEKRAGNKAKMKSAHDLLDDAARTRGIAHKEHISHLLKRQENGEIASNLPRETLEKQAMTFAFHNQATHIVNAPLSTDQFAELDQSIRDIEHQNGPTMTENHGDMRLYGGTNTPAAQRARNTRITIQQPTPNQRVTASAHHCHSHPSNLPPSRQVPTPRVMFASAAAAATTTAKESVEPTPDYIAEPRNLCDDLVAFGGADETKAIVLRQVSTALNERDEHTVKTAKRWADRGKTAEEIVDGLSNIKRAENGGQQK